MVSPAGNRLPRIYSGVRFHRVSHVYTAFAVAIVLLIVSALHSADVAGADSTVTFNTTAGFDAGSKTHEGETPYFVNDGIDQPTYDFITTPSAVYSPERQRTYVVYQATNNYIPMVTYYDHTSGVWATPQAAASSNPVNGDGHGAPAIWMDSIGYLYVFYGSHATNQKVRKTVNPHDISSWVSATDAATQSTYPHVFGYGSSIYMLYRAGFAPVGADWRFKRTTDGGATWIDGNTILDFGATDSSYLYHIHLRGARVYYSFVFLDSVVDKRFNAYAAYWDLTNDHQFSLSDVDLGTTITGAEANASLLVRNSGAAQLYYTDMDLDASGNAYLLYTEGNGPSFNINFTKWNGASWGASTLLKTSIGSSPGQHLAISITSQTEGEAFLTTGGMGFKNADAYDDYNGDMERWTWNGIAWAFQETIMSEERNGDPLNRPYYIINPNPKIQVIFDSWVAQPNEPLILGKDTNVPRARLFAWGTSGIVGNRNIAMGTPWVETTTENPRIASNTFQLANGLSDSFSFQNETADTYKWRGVLTGDGFGPITHSLANGVFKVTASPAGGSGRQGFSLRGNFGISGEWDIRIKADVTDGRENGELGYQLCMWNQPDDCDPVGGKYFNGTEGVYYMFIAPPFNLFRAFQYVGGTLTQIGTDTTSACNPCWMRTTKIGTTFTFYRSSNGISWTQDEQATIPALSGDFWIPHFGPASNGVTTGTWSIEMDDFNLAGGSLVNGYRPSGLWVSPTQGYSGDKVIADTITVAYSGASAGAFIDVISIINSIGDVIYEDRTNRESGTTVTVQIPHTDEMINGLRQDWRIRVDLRGDGSHSVAVSSISVSTAMIETAGEIAVRQALNVFWLFVFVVVCVLMVLGAWQIHRRMA